MPTPNQPIGLRDRRQSRRDSRRGGPLVSSRRAARRRVSARTASTSRSTTFARTWAHRWARATSTKRASSPAPGTPGGSASATANGPTTRGFGVDTFEVRVVGRRNPSPLKPTRLGEREKGRAGGSQAHLTSLCVSHSRLLLLALRFSASRRRFRLLLAPPSSRRPASPSHRSSGRSSAGSSVRPRVASIVTFCFSVVECSRPAVDVEQHLAVRALFLDLHLHVAAAAGCCGCAVFAAASVSQIPSSAPA